MDLKEINIYPVESTAHFGAVASLMNTVDTEPNTAESLAEWFNKQLADGILLFIAADLDSNVHGFYCIYRTNTNIDQYYGMSLVVATESRRKGLGNHLYEHMLIQAARLNVHTLRVRVRDNSEYSIRFARQRGFVQKVHSIEMMLDLNTWDDQKYEPLLATLRGHGFHFTNMADLGDTQASRRKLYALNNGAAATDPGSVGIPPWSSFEEFERDVCNASWYHPDEQIVAIDTHTGEWASMSAITVFTGSDHAYNLFTGTDIHYRERKLAQAVKTIALRKARTFGVGVVRTSHSSENAAMIAIDTKLGYIRTPGMLVMEKELVHV
jgi:L-amino acid N-acyltransferase YncA/RimJ/RimL family protein N-acetyltransferase